MNLPVSVLAQFAWSASSFAVALLLLRYLSVTEYGWFALVLAVRQFLVMLQAALVITPMTLLAGESPGQAGAAHKVQQLAGIITLLALLLVGLVGFYASVLPDHPSNRAAAVFLMGGLAVEHQRRLCYLNGRYLRDLLGGVLHAVLSLSLLVSLSMLGTLDLAQALLVIGLLSLAWGLLPLGGLLWRYPGPGAWSAFAHTVRISAWMLGSNFSGYVYNRASTWYTLALLGLESVAVLELGRQIVTLAQSFIAAMANYWQPLLARLAREATLANYFRKVGRISLAQSAAGALLLLALLAFSKPLVALLAADNAVSYGAAIPVAWCLSGAVIAQLLWQHASYSLLVFRRPSHAFYAKSIAATVMIPVGYWLVLEFGLLGAALVWTIGEVLFLLLIVAFIAQLFRDQHGGSEHAR